MDEIEEARLNILRLEENATTKYFSMSSMWGLLKRAGWTQPSSTFLQPGERKYDRLYMAPWALKTYEEWRANNAYPSRFISEFIEGRDYFFENDDIANYIRKHGTYYYHYKSLVSHSTQLL